MVKVRKYSSVEEFKQALKQAIEKKETLNSLLRSGASKEDLENAGIRLVQFS